MSEEELLSAFLAKLTVLCRKYNVELCALRTHLDDPPIVTKLSDDKKNWVYAITKAPWDQNGSWHSLALTDGPHDSAIETEFCMADQSYIRLIEAGLD